MKTLLIVTLLIMMASPAMATGEHVSSDHKPVIQRLQGCILFPYDIEAIAVFDGDGKTSRTAYRFKYLRVADAGQQIKDRATFVAENAHLMAMQAMQIEAVNRDAAVATKIAELQSAVETKLNTDFSREMKIAPIEEVSR